MTDTSKGYVFFWGGEFSQWATSPFELDGNVYNTAEQWMMYQKAMTFGDEDMAIAIMQSKEPSHQKALGRRVQPFDEAAWSAVAYDHVVRGNMAKFSQNKHFFDYMMTTKDAQIVEASPHDNIWGIGFHVNEAKKTDPSIWKNHDNNLLGKALMEVRSNLITAGNINLDNYDDCPDIFYYDE